MRRHVAVQPRSLAEATPTYELDEWEDEYQPFPPLPVHTTRCAACEWPDVCAKDKTCWKDPAITLKRKRIDPPRLQVVEWTVEEAIAAFKAFHKKHNRLPRYDDLRGGVHGLPALKTCQRLFGSWSEALAAAGLKPRRWRSK